jgi:type IV fimbrial biogenesis protein FimT
MKPLPPGRQHGVTLVELMIVMALLAMLVSFAAPNFQDAIRNAQVRTTAESILNGLQRARSEAILRNRQVKMTLTNKTNDTNDTAQRGGTDWEIYSSDQASMPPTFTELIEQRNAMEDTGNTRIGIKTTPDFASPAAAGSGMPADIAFNGMGRLTSGTTARQIDIKHASASSARRLSVVISPGGDIRLCDPALSVSTSFQGCQ